MHHLVQKWTIRLMVLGLMVIGTVLLSASPQLIYAQDNLSPGDIAFVEYNADGTDNFKFVTLVDISASTVISFTDNGWLASGSFRANEGIIAWTAPVGGVAAGTVVNIDTSPSASAGSVNETGSLNFSGSGDQVIAYQGSSTIIAALNNQGAATWQADATDSNSSALPQGLTNGTNAVAINEVDNVAYSGITSGDKATLLAALNNPDNWTGGSNSTNQSFSGSFTVNTPTTYDLQVTEIFPGQSGTDLTEDWFEIENVGTAAWVSGSDPDLYYDDESSDPADALAISGLTQLDPNQAAIVVIGTSDDATTFTNVWENDIDLSGIEVGFVDGSGLGGGGDAVTLWVGNPNTSDVLADNESYPDTGANDGQSYDVTLAAFSTVGNANNAVQTTALGGNSNDTPNIGSPGNQGAVVTNPNAPTIQVDTINLTPFLNLPADDTGSVSGVISDPTDPASIIGIPFDLTDADTNLNDLIITATSDNQSVVADGNLVLVGTGADRMLAITPSGVGFANITVTVEDLDNNTDTYIIQYAASAASVDPSTSRFHTGAADGSTAIPVNADYMWVGDDEDQVLRLYDRDASGLPLTEIDFDSSLGTSEEVDIEGSFMSGDTIYWIGSHTNDDRSVLFTTVMTGSGASAFLIYGDKYTALRDDLVTWDSNNDHGLGANFFNLSTSFELEGLALAPGSSTTAYLGFRGPLSGNKALIVPVTNFTSLPGSTAGSATFDTPILLNLNGRSVRSIECNTNGCVIIGGPVGTVVDFALYTWSGNPADAPQLRAADLTALNTNGSFEGIVELPSTTFLGSDGNTDSIELLVDNGVTDFYGDGSEAKDLRDEWKKFRSEVVTLGEVVVPMAAAPVINEFVVDDPGGDEFEFVEIFGDPNTDYSAYTLLQIEGDGPTSAGTIDSVFTVGTTDGNGYWTTPLFLTNEFENGTITLLLVENFTGADGNDLDTDDDGTFDLTPWASIIDSVGKDEGASGELVYSSVNLTPNYDGITFEVGGASRIPNGTDTDSTDDWLRNDFDGAGLPEQTGTPEEGEAFNTPGAQNEAVPGPAPDLQITEIWPGNEAGDDLTEDWFEIVNKGSVAWTPDLGNLFFDDDSQDPGSADLISGISSIQPGEAVIAIDDTVSSTFVSVWGPVYNLSGVQIGTYQGSGLSSSGDGVTLFSGDSTAETILDFAAYPDASGNPGASYDVEKGAFSQIGEQPYEPVATAANNEGESAIGSPGNQGPILLVCTEAIPIADVQGTGDVTPEAGNEVTIRGLVTAVFGSEIMVQENSSNPRSGIVVFSSDNSAARGDEVCVTGIASERFGQTQIGGNNNPNATIDILSNNNALPAPAVVTTNEIATGSASAEQWEAVLVRVENVTVTNEDLGFGEFAVDDGNGEVRVDDKGSFTYSPTLNDALTFVQGPLNFTFSNYKIEPRDDDDIGTPPTGDPFPLAENFDSCALPGWQIISVDADKANTWSCSEQFSNVDVSGFGNSAPANEWLITPPLDLNAQDNDTLTFRNYTNFSDINYPQLEVLYSTDFSGDPTTASWTPLTGINFSPEDSGQWVDSGKIDLSGISGNNVYFAFHYTSSGTSGGSAANWRVDEVNFFADETDPPVAAKIHQVQGAGTSVTNPGTQVTVEGVVVGDYQGSDELNGFFIQEEASEADADPNTSEGIFVFCGGCAVDVTEGQIVQVTGLQEEFFDMSQLDVPAATNGNVTIIDAGNNLNLVTPASVNLPAPASTSAESTFEQYEGMLVEFVDELTVTEYFEMARYGQIVLSEGGKLRQFTNDNQPDATGYANHLEEIAQRRIILDDLNNTQNSTDPVYHPQPGGFSTSNFIRGGYTVSNLTGIMHWSFAGQSGTNAWRIRPQITNPVTFTPSNPRQATPDDVGGDIKVATLNVLNYFTTIDLTESRNVGDCSPSSTLDCRGADSNAELQRQTDKLVVALQAMDADIFALVELENNAAAAPAGDGVDPVLEAIVDALNNVVGAGTYDFVDAGTIGTDAIKVAYIYKTSTIALFGDFAVLDSNDFVNPNNLSTPKNRPALAQTFQVIEPNNPSFGEKFTTVVNHLKSKGSGCGAGDDDTTTGQGNCNDTRTKAAEKLVDWLATDPTNSGDPDFMILGDINAYAMEDPIQAIKEGADDTLGTDDDFTNLIALFGGPNAYSFVFSGQWGYLDHALANNSMTAQVTGLTGWHINADEVNLLDYNDDIQDTGERSFEAKPGANPLYSPDQYRVSDHDPVIVGLSLGDSEAVLVNSTLNNTDISTSYDPSPVANAPAGVFTISATFTNISSDTLKDIYFEVAKLTGGNLLLNADDGPGGVGSQISVSLDTAGENGDTVLSPGESFTIDFEIGLQQRQRFSFFVDAYGVVVDGSNLTALSIASADSFKFEIEEEQLVPAAEQGQDIYFPLIVK